MPNHAPSDHLSVLGNESKEGLRSTGRLALSRRKLVNLDSAVLSDDDAAWWVRFLQLRDFDVGYWRFALFHIAVHLP